MELTTDMDFFDVLVRYETQLWNHLDDRLQTAGAVSLATLSALRVVRRRTGGCRVQEIRTDLGITVGAASKLVDRLERDGLAVRSAHPQDRRSSLIALTPAGDAAHDTGVALLDSALTDHLAGERSAAATTVVLQRLMSRLGATSPEVPR
ncbi:MarR family winged helix-turn-helix transcriptional regulator [Pengzhenrongella frigida]|uniref:MarR family transcriptional regulator n=1 Tax=Pengzhenrongella frigida TaxID=1259133 RepID=A0A4Q5N5K2_9MICO|nr:MarR family transcriptional regulator [Cellulomonas sp. HLT2-17]RYV52813.1 MarR family transcriptional regulator [Cellulomonas sp. HLT2-17]